MTTTADEALTRSIALEGYAFAHAPEMRALLTEAAAWRWLVAVEQVELHDGAAHAPNGDSLGYGELATLLSLHVEAKPDVARREKGVRLIGTDLARVDIPAKVTGGVAYVQDMRLPGMLHARVVRGPSEGTRLKPPDFDAVAKMPGIVQVVRDGGFTAVLATQEWQAIKALQRLQSAGWDRPGGSRR